MQYNFSYQFGDSDEGNIVLERVKTLLQDQINQRTYTHTHT